MTSREDPAINKVLIDGKNRSHIKVIKRMVHCLIIDEHPVYRLGIEQLLEGEQNIRLAASVNTVAELLADEPLPPPELAILNVSIEGHNSLESIKRLKERFPGILILVISLYDEKFLARRIIRAGAHGYLMKDAVAREVKQALEDILAGKIYFSDNLRNFMLESLFDYKLNYDDQRIESMSDKEFEVFILMGKGISMNEIADKLDRTLSTIETYKRNIKKMLNFAKTAKLKEFAVRWVKVHRIYQ